MPPNRINRYEGMFLIGQASATDLASAVEHIQGLLDRVQANLIALAKWDERRLAYEINKQKRGLYLLAYFDAPAQNMAQLERDCQLSETLMRVLFTRADHLTDEEIAANDDREGLMNEAKLRAARAAEEREKAEDTSVRVGRPPEQAKPEPQAEPKNQAQPEAQPESQPEAPAQPQAGATAQQAETQPVGDAPQQP